MTDLAARLAALSPDKRALYERLLREQARAENAFPLSLPQQGIWFFEQLRPHNPAYVITAAARLRGPLDTGALREAVARIVRRHEALRTTFELRDGKPVQVVRADLAVELPVTDLGGAAPVGDIELAERVAEVLAGPFDLAAGPLLRARLLRVGPDEHVLAVAMHHLVADGWSVGVLLGELSEHYAAVVTGRPAAVPELAVQYGDYASWQRSAARESAADLDHWRRQLAGAPAVLPLPTDRPRPPVQRLRGGAVPFDLPAPLMRELAALGRRHRATPYMALLATLEVLLHRCCGTDDILVGVPAANRGRAELEPLIGFFVTMLPVRVDLGGDPDFAAVLDRVRDACLGAYAHQAVPFERIVAELNLPRDLSVPPVFQVCLTYQSDPLATLSVAGVELTRLPVRGGGSRFDLELQCFDTDGALAGWFEYDRDLFDESTVARLAGLLRRVVELVVAEPGTPVSRLPLLAGADRAAELAAAVGPVREWAEPGWLPAAVAARARQVPDAPAVRFRGEEVGYAELAGRVARLAHRLRALGAGPGTVVGVAAHRSVELVTALVGVVAAGAAYLPLDPELPPARLAGMLADSAPVAVLTQRSLAAGLPATTAPVLALDDPAEVARLAALPDTEPPVRLDGADAAYVIYTSGSTGAPKGVVNVHSAIRNRLRWMQAAYPIGPGDRVLQKTPFSFDVSVWEFFWPLLEGATLVVAEPGGHRDPAYLVRTIQAERITVAHFVPSMLAAFLREPGVEDCTSLRHVVCSGEALPAELAARFTERCGARLHNLYGPTEAAVDVTAWTCPPGAVPDPVPLGAPIANTSVHLLDRHLEPVPPGTPGEIHLAGANLARGYHGRAALTADRFVPDPYGPPGSRLYRTGDLARRGPDGLLRYLGRTDAQTKIRGFRVEPGEIEAALTRQPAVAAAAVVATGSGADARLVGYVTPADPAHPPAQADLAAALRAELPDYMVPAAFVVLPALPVTANGKLDRAALPAPAAARPELAVAYVEPRGELERSLAALWCELLGVPRVGADDNFFELGGHSLLLAELRTRLAAGLGREVSLVELFQYPTVGSLAAHLAAAADGTPAADRAARAGRDRADQRRQLQAQRRPAPRRVPTGDGAR